MASYCKPPSQGNVDLHGSATLRNPERLALQAQNNQSDAPKGSPRPSLTETPAQNTFDEKRTPQRDGIHNTTQYHLWVSRPEGFRGTRGEHELHQPHEKHLSYDLWITHFRGTHELHRPESQGLISVARTLDNGKVYGAYHNAPTPLKLRRAHFHPRKRAHVHPRKRALFHPRKREVGMGKWEKQMQMQRGLVLVSV